jgi:hypothetical protein
MSKMLPNQVWKLLHRGEETQSVKDALLKMFPKKGGGQSSMAKLSNDFQEIGRLTRMIEFPTGP